MWWDYRVVREKLENGDETFTIREVLYDSHGKMNEVTESLGPFGESFGKLQQDIANMALALLLPIINEEDVPEEGAEGFLEDE